MKAGVAGLRTNTRRKVWSCFKLQFSLQKVQVGARPNAAQESLRGEGGRSAILLANPFTAFERLEANPLSLQSQLPIVSSTALRPANSRLKT